MHFTSYNGNDNLIIKEHELNLLKPAKTATDIKLRHLNQNINNRTVIIIDDKIIQDTNTKVSSVKQKAELFEKKIKSSSSSSNSSSENDSPKKLNNQSSTTITTSSLSSSSSLSSNLESGYQQSSNYNYIGKFLTFFLHKF